MGSKDTITFLNCSPFLPIFSILYPFIVAPSLDTRVTSQHQEFLGMKRESVCVRESVHVSMGAWVRERERERESAATKEGVRREKVTNYKVLKEKTSRRRVLLFYDPSA